MVPRLPARAPRGTVDLVTTPDSAPARPLPARVLGWLESWPSLRRLDRAPFGRSLVLGLLLGAAVGAALLVYAPPGERLAVAAVVILAAGLLAWSGQPVGIWEPAEETEPLLDMVAIEGGTFLMGSPEDEKGRFDNEKRHRVTVLPFRIGRTTITRAQYREVMDLDDAPGPGGDDHPVSEVSWFDVTTFCNRLSEREELAPCYRIDDQKVSWIEDTGGYRLPTEAEWEYAVRAGTEGRWSFGDDESELDRYAWSIGNSDDEPHPVAAREPNPWGLHDMHGNVWEWCWDAYEEYRKEPATDPRGAEKAPGALRVLRGGAFLNVPGVLRSAIRNWNEPENSNTNIGLASRRRRASEILRPSSPPPTCGSTIPMQGLPGPSRPTSPARPFR